MNKSNIIFIRGLPGSGKSFIADKIEKTIGKDNVVKLDPDATDYNSVEYSQACEQMREQGVDEKLFPYRFLRAQAYRGIEQGKLVVWNQAFTNANIFRKMVDGLTNYAEERGIELVVLVVEVNIDSVVAQNRIKQRVARGGHDVPNDRFDKFLQDYSTLAEEGYNVLIVDGQDNVDSSADKILKTLT